MKEKPRSMFVCALVLFSAVVLALAVDLSASECTGTNVAETYEEAPVIAPQFITAGDWTEKDKVEQGAEGYQKQESEGHEGYQEEQPEGFQAPEESYESDELKQDDDSAEPRESLDEESTS